MEIFLEDLPIYDVVGGVGGAGGGELRRVTLKGDVEESEVDVELEKGGVYTSSSRDLIQNDTERTFQTESDLKKSTEADHHIDGDNEWETDEETVTSRTPKRTKINSAKRKQTRFKVLLTSIAPAPIASKKSMDDLQSAYAAAAEYQTASKSEAYDHTKHTELHHEHDPTPSSLKQTPHPATPPPPPPKTPPTTRTRHPESLTIKFDTSDSEDDAANHPPETLHKVMSQTQETKTELTPQKGSSYSVQKPEERRVARQVRVYINFVSTFGICEMTLLRYAQKKN